MAEIFGLVWLSLLLAPLLAVVIARIWRPAKLVLVAGIVLGGVALAMVLRLRFVSDFANFLALSLAYLAYCLLAVTLWRIPNIFLRWAAIAVSVIPVVVGYILATVGVLGLMFILGDETNPSSHHEVIPPDYSCTIRRFGNATADNGYRVTLFQHWPLLSFVRYEAGSLMVNETHPEPGRKTATCADALQAFGKQAKPAHPPV